MSRSGRAPATALGVAAVLGVAGCGPVNAGDAAVPAAEDWMRDVDGVASVDLGGVNTLPWSGEISGTVTLEAEADAGTAEDVVARMRAFPGSVPLRADLEWEVAGVTTSSRAGRFPPGGAAALRDYATSVRALLGAGSTLEVSRDSRKDLVVDVDAWVEDASDGDALHAKLEQVPWPGGEVQVRDVTLVIEETDETFRGES